MAFGSLLTTTIREFDGGLDIVDSDLNMNTRYSKVETNVFNGIDGTKSKRYGTKFFKDVKSYTDTEEIYETCPVIVDKTLNIPQDTIHNVKVGDKITVKSPEKLKGDYTITEDYIGNFYVNHTLSDLDKTYLDVEYIINDNENSKLKTTVTTYTNKMSFIKYNNKLVVVGYKVNVTAPEEIKGEYEVIAADDEDFDIKLKSEVALESFTNIKYTYREDTVEKFAASGTLSTKKLLQFDYADKNQLLIGHKLTIVNNEKLNGEYTVIDRNDTSYYIDITDKGVNSEQSNIEIVHNNRKIAGNRIINGEYFIDKLILVSDIGEVIAVDGVGDASIIWNENIAKHVNKEDVEGWHETTSACFTVFNGVLTIWNGRDKPLAVDLTKNIPCNFLIDEGTGSNANVPIAKYALAFNHYLVAANIFDELEGKYYPDRISISSRDTIGTFYSGDLNDIDNDAVYLDLGKIISSNKQTIKGLARHRNKIAVGFDDVTVFGTLGNYVDDVRTVGEEEVTYKLHNPLFEDVVDSYGCVSNRSIQAINSELVCLDYSGIPIFRQGTLTAQVVPARISDKVAPEIYKQFIGLTENTIEDRIFSVNNPKEGQYLLFIPNDDDTKATTETICYAYTLHNKSNSSARDGAWSKFVGWNFQFGITTALNIVFLGNGTKLYTLGNIDDPVYADFVGDPDYAPVDEEDLDGKTIDFDWEFPWADFGDRAATKHSRYVSLFTSGTAQFNLDLFVDYIYYNIDTQQLDPALSLEFVAGDSPGWGGGKQHYGAGRRTNTEFLFAYPTKFKIAKFRFHGSSKEKLSIVGLTIYYQKGNIRR